MPRIGRELDLALLEMLEASAKSIKAVPINLGGISGPGGGVGVPPAGFIGQLSQTRIAYDTSEIASSGVPASGASLLDNLNHIRYRLSTLESGGSGSITVSEFGGVPTVSPTTKITFSGADVIDMGGGEALVAISGGGGGLTDAPSDGFLYGRKNAAWSRVSNEFLKLDGSNDPVTGGLQIIPTTSGETGVYIQTGGDAYGIDVEQFSTGVNINSPTQFLYREINTTGSITAGMIEGMQKSTGSASITGKFIDLSDITTGKYFRVDNTGSVDIPSGSSYKINGVPIGSAAWGGITGTLSNQTDLQNELNTLASKEIIFATNPNEFFRFQSTRTTQFTATIASIPNTTTITYNNPTAGGENELAQYNGLAAQTSSNLCGIVLRNTTRGNDAIILDTNLSTNTVTFTAAIPSNWAVGDTITTDAGMGSSYRAVQIKGTSVIPNGVTQLLLFVQVLDSVGSTQAWLQSYETFSAPKTWVVAHTAGANLSLTSFVTLPLISRRILWQVRPPANGDTSTIVCRLIGYKKG